MANDNVKIVDIPSEKFEFVNAGEKIHDTKFETKPIGYLKDALIRFCKNKASVAAFIIIIFIILYALIIPFTTPKAKAVVMDPYYSKKAPRNVVLKETFGIMGGTKKLEQNERALIVELAKGVGAEFDVIWFFGTAGGGVAADANRCFFIGNGSKRTADFVNGYHRTTDIAVYIDSVGAFYIDGRNIF